MKSKAKTYQVKITVPGKGSDYLTIMGSSANKIAHKLLMLGILASDFKEVPPTTKAQLSTGDI